MFSRFGKPDGNTQHHTPTCFRINANGNKYSTITYDFIPSHFGVSGIEEKMGYGRDGAISPFLKQGIKLSAALAYISGRDAVAPTNLILVDIYCVVARLLSPPVYPKSPARARKNSPVSANCRKICV